MEFFERLGSKAVRLPRRGRQAMSGAFRLLVAGMMFEAARQAARRGAFVSLAVAQWRWWLARHLWPRGDADDDDGSSGIALGKCSRFGLVEDVDDVRVVESVGNTIYYPRCYDPALHSE